MQVQMMPAKVSHARHYLPKSNCFCAEGSGGIKVKPSKYYSRSSYSIDSGISNAKQQPIRVLSRGYYTNPAVEIAVNLTPLRMSEQISF